MPTKDITKDLALDAATTSLARKFAPILLCDRLDPFQPIAIGLSKLKPGENSPSCPHHPPLQGPEGTETILEYAIWWDGDIQHLYELEHVWIYLDQKDAPIHVNASAHGGMLDMSAASWRDKQIMLHCEPGKHAHAATKEQVTVRKSDLDAACMSGKRLRGVLIQSFFSEQLSFLSHYDQFLAREHLKSLCFEPTYQFEQQFDLSALPFMSWGDLRGYIPRFMRDQTERLRKNKKGVKAVFLDCGDTLIDQGTQVFSETQEDLVLAADPIDTARELLMALHQRGYPVALVADGREESFQNILRANALWEYFDTHIISENLATRKPDERMFHEAMLHLGLRREDASGIVMMGNNLSRDIRGANALDIISVWLDWEDRYPKTPADELEHPDYTIAKPIELLEILDALDREHTKEPSQL